MCKFRTLFVIGSMLAGMATFVSARERRPETFRSPARVAPAPGDRVGQLIYALQTGSVHSRHHAASELGFIGGERAVMPLSRAAMCDPDRQVREDALEALGRIGSPRGVGACVYSLQHEPDGDTRERAAQSLGYIGDRSALSALQCALRNDQDRHVRSEAKRAIRRILARAPQATCPPGPGKRGPGYRGGWE